MFNSKARIAGVTDSTSLRNLGAIAVTALLGAICFRYTYRLGFDWGDMGSYAEIARGLAAGSSPADYVGYGPLWHFIGAGLFRLFGVDFGALLIFFHLMIIACAVVIMQALRTVTGMLWPGLVVALAIICVPPYLASSMRLLTLAMFVWPFLAVARADPDRDFVAVLAAAATIGIIVILRPDFAYLYSTLLGAFVLWRGLTMSCPVGDRVAYLCKRAIATPLVILVVLVPITIDAILRNYSEKLLADTLSYPLRFLVLLGLGGTGAASGRATDGASPLTYLKMPPISAIFDFSSDTQIFAVLIYSTQAVLAAAALLTAWRMLSRRHEASENQVLLAVLMIAASQWPIFALFRPGWVHFVGFVHAYLILAVCLLVWLPRLVTPADVIGIGLMQAARVFIFCQIALFVGYGTFFGETGLGTKLNGRSSVFEGRNGVRVLVSSGEKRIYDNIAGIIESNSKPRDRIVCVPYCAGFAFMTDRIPLFREHYVDDSTPFFRPGWIDQAIALTDSVRPPVVIVLDWAPNNSDASRFDVWASRYIDYLRQTYPVSGRFEMGTVWLRDVPKRSPAGAVAVLDYGPKSTRAGETFNRQPNGQSALWMKLGADPGAGASVRLDGRDLVTGVAGDAVTALVPPDALTRSGRRELKVVNPLRNLESVPVQLEVLQP
jgi:hypothetical protein